MGPSTWPMFHWKLSMLRATGTSEDGTRLLTVFHHDGDEVPLAIPTPARPMRSVAGVSAPAAETSTRKSAEESRISFARSRIARRSRASAAAPESDALSSPVIEVMAAASVTSTGTLVRLSMMKPLTRDRIQIPMFEKTAVPSSQRNARTPKGARREVGAGPCPGGLAAGPTAAVSAVVLTARPPRPVRARRAPRVRGGARAQG